MGAAVVVLNILNALLFASLGVWLRKRLGSEPGSTARFVVSLGGLTFGALTVGAIGRALTRSVEVGWLPANDPREFIDGLQITVSGVLFAAGMAAAYLLPRRIVQLSNLVTTVDVVRSRTASIPPHEWKLTPRQKEVLRTIIAGHVTDEEIAADLFISKNTAHTHVNDLLRKTGLTSRRDLALLAPFVSDP